MDITSPIQQKKNMVLQEEKQQNIKMTKNRGIEYKSQGNLVIKLKDKS